MKYALKILGTAASGALLLPVLAFAQASNELTLTTDTVITANSVSVNVYTESAVMETMTVDAGGFTVRLAPNSLI